MEPRWYHSNGRGRAYSGDRHPEPLHGEHGNGERLEVLGARMLRAAYTAALAGMYSFRNDELEVRRLLHGLRTRCADDDWALTVRGRRDMSTGRSGASSNIA